MDGDMNGQRGIHGDVPPRMRAVLFALAAILLLALAVCALVVSNAIAPRGQALLSDYMQSDGTAEQLVLLTEEPWTAHGVLHIRGALLRMDQPVGAVNMRVALIPLHPDTGAWAQQEATLLNTQMVRRFDYAAEYGCDDHCGFSAAVQISRLPTQADAFRVALLDAADGVRRLMETDVVVRRTADGLAFVRDARYGEEGQNDR